MVWVKSELTDELAVVCTWLAMVVPWNVAYLTDGPLDSTVAFFRFGVLELQFRFPSEITLGGVPLDVAKALAVEYSGVQLAGSLYLTVPPAAALHHIGLLAVANAAWTVAAVIMAGLFGLSIAMYRREERTRSRLPMAYHRLVGWGLAVITVLLAVTTGLFYLERAIVGVPIPVGLVIVGLLAGVLLRAETVEDSDSPS